MKRFAVLRLAVHSLLNRRLTVALTVLAIALSVGLFLSVEKLRAAARDGFEQTIAETDLIAGARTGPLHLLLFSVFHIGGPSEEMSYDSYEAIAALPAVAWAVPLALGDSYEGFRVVGTNAGFFEHFRYGDAQALRFAAGQFAGGTFDAVLGAAVARSLAHAVGDELVLAHGLASADFAAHDDRPFRVSGVLAPTGTPVDRSVLISLAGVEAMHVGWQGGAPTPMARLLPAERLERMALQPEHVSAVLVGLRSPAALLAVKRAIDGWDDEPLTAVAPGIELTRLWEAVGVAERLLRVVTVLVVAVGLLSVLASILASLGERRREMAILRAVGARPRDIVFLLLSEAAVVAACGSLAGVLLVSVGLAIGAPAAQAQLGVGLTGVARPGAFELLVVAAVTMAATAMALLPALLAYRRSLADGMTVRL